MSPLVEEPFGDVAVGVDAAVAEEGPVAADFVLQLGIALVDEDLFLVARCFGEDPAKRVGEERVAPEFEACISGPFFEADAVDRGDVDAVGDGMAALDGLPCVELGGAVLFFFSWMPADGGGVEKNAGALEGGEAGGFRVPLVPTDEDADAGELRIEIFEAEVAGVK